MAEFSEVMRQWQRLCETRSRQYGDDDSKTCDECPLTKAGITCGGIFETPTDTDWDACENAIMTWAAAHTEPVYPTWWSWLINEGVIEKGSTYTGAFDQLKTKSIPADIAEKLGIEPKEPKEG